MPDLPFSDISIIAVALGIFFLIVAFYKSIFHKRRHPGHAASAPVALAPPAKEEQPIKLSQPFQQIPLDVLPDLHKQQSPVSFYPAAPRSAETSVSAFRPFNPNREFNTASSGTANESNYEWE